MLLKLHTEHRGMSHLLFRRLRKFLHAMLSVDLRFSVHLLLIFLLLLLEILAELAVGSNPIAVLNKGERDHAHCKTEETQR